MDKLSYTVHQVLYLDNVCGIPQIGHFVTNDTNESDQTYVDNADTPDLIDFMDRTVQSGVPVRIMAIADFMGKIPKVLAN